MATINDQGNIQARCPGCRGALSSFEWRHANGVHGALKTQGKYEGWGACHVDYRLFQCAGCGRGGLGEIYYQLHSNYPGAFRALRSFTPEARERMRLPDGVPEGIVKEFTEGERCLDAGCLRAAAGMFRSVLDKTLRASGYKVKKGTPLDQQIDAAAADAVITKARQLRAHDEIRVLGNDVLHDEWREIPLEDVEAARHYAQRILEDLYDDRPSVLALLRAAGKVPDEDKPQDPDV